MYAPVTFEFRSPVRHQQNRRIKRNEFAKGWSTARLRDPQASEYIAQSNRTVLLVIHFNT